MTELLQEMKQYAGQQSYSPDEQRQMIQVLTTLLEGTARERKSALSDLPMQEVRGQEYVKRALEVAAAGGHTILLAGPSGVGKRFLARMLPSLLPQTMDSFSIREPSASIDLAAWVGRSDPLILGELTRAHEGFLLLGDLSTFDRAHLNALRQAVEQQVITPQGNEHALFPAHFLLVATIQLCSCGFFSDPAHACRCLTEDIIAYQRHTEAVVTSCFDMYIEVAPVEEHAVLDRRAGETSVSIRQRVEQARTIQQRRFIGTPFQRNADLRTISEIQHYAPLDSGAERLLKAAIHQLHLSVQQTLRLQPVARSIADLAQSDTVIAPHMAEAIQYRLRIGW